VAGHPALRTSAPVVDGRLYVLGDAIEADADRVSWLPRDASGYQPVNGYLLVEGDRRLMVDTGLPVHEQAVLSQLGSLLPDGASVELCLTRAELDCSGNVGAISRAVGVSAVRTGGRPNPFDAFDMIQDVQSDAGAGRLPISRMRGEAPVELSPTRTVEMLAAPLRILTTFWVYDSGTRTLFTSDSFGHMLAGDVDESRVVAGDAAPDLERVQAHLFAKFGWLERAIKTKLIERLDAVFEDRVVEIIAPAHGRVLRGAALVEAHHQAVRQALDSRPAPAPVDGRSDSWGQPADPAAASTGERRREQRSLPRRLTPDIVWMGGCLELTEPTFTAHVHNACYLVLGERETILVDTGLIPNWDAVAAQLDDLLGDRPLDWIFPTHPELPHVGNLHRLLAKYPAARITGDMRDYHLFFSQYEDRLVQRAPGEELDLGGRRLIFLEALIKDLPTTMWAYESAGRVLFTADAFGYSHGGLDELRAEDPIHTPGECGLYASQLPAPPTIPQTAFLTRTALTWSQYVDVAPHFAAVERLFERCPIDFIASAHGNVIDDFDTVMPIMRQAYEVVFEGG
jgi:flavorubredoxin